jgi:hypothetical protein
MDSVSAVVATLAAGAVAALKDTAQQAIKDAYAALKGALARKYPAASVDQVEKRPDSTAKRASLEEDLRDAGATSDQELLALAKALAMAVEQHDSAAAQQAGVILRDVKAATFTARRIDAAGSGVVVEKAEFSGDVTVEDVRSGKGSTPKG